MTPLAEKKLEHTFGAGWVASKYDDWPFYRDHFEQGCSGNKAVDFVAVDPARETAWLVELKDYRVHRRTKGIDLIEEVAIKVRDSLAGLFAAAKHHAHHAHAEQARLALGAARVRVVLHLEQPRRTSKLFPRRYELVDLQQRLKQRVRAVDPHPIVTEVGAATTPPWSIRSIP
jgi:hypothetical protein